jgi:hypothetical protein
LRELLNARLEQFKQLLCSVKDLEAMHIIVDEECAKFIYDPIIHQKEHPEASSWCVAFVDLLKYVFQFNEWVHTMDRQTDVDFKQETCLSFLIHTNTDSWTC